MIRYLHLPYNESSGRKDATGPYRHSLQPRPSLPPPAQSRPSFTPRPYQPPTYQSPSPSSLHPPPLSCLTPSFDKENATPTTYRSPSPSSLHSPPLSRRAPHRPTTYQSPSPSSLHSPPLSHRAPSFDKENATPNVRRQKKNETMEVVTDWFKDEKRRTINAFCRDSGFPEKRKAVERFIESDGRLKELKDKRRQQTWDKELVSKALEILGAGWSPVRPQVLEIGKTPSRKEALVSFLNSVPQKKRDASVITQVEEEANIATVKLKWDTGSKSCTKATVHKSAHELGVILHNVSGGNFASATNILDAMRSGTKMTGSVLPEPLHSQEAAPSEYPSPAAAPSEHLPPSGHPPNPAAAPSEHPPPSATEILDLPPQHPVQWVNNMRTYLKDLSRGLTKFKGTRTKAAQIAYDAVTEAVLYKSKTRSGDVAVSKVFTNIQHFFHTIPNFDGSFQPLLYVLQGCHKGSWGN